MSSRLLSEITYSKRKFNPNDKQDRKLAHKFLKEASWSRIASEKSCPFICEWPYVNIPAMLKDKLLEYYSNKA